LLPQQLRRPLRTHLERIKELHRQDVARCGGRVYLPFALKRKYPNAERAWIWQYVFPAAKPSLDPQSGEMRRHHVSEKNLQNAVKLAIRSAGIKKAASCHISTLLRNASAGRRLRHSHRPGAARAQERRHHDDLHSRSKPTRVAHPKST